MTEPIGKYDEVVVAFITSKIPFNKLPSDLILHKAAKNFVKTGLPHSSTIRLHKLTTINLASSSQIFGVLPQNLQHQVTKKLEYLLGD